jgi:RNA polymerase sigma factor (sigma-70 family)
MSADISDVVADMPGLAAALSLHSDEPGDEYLISALAGGAVWAMDLLYQRYSGLLYSLAYRVVADLRVAEDLLQEVFLAVWQHAPSYDSQSGSVSGWLTSIMRHRAIDHLRRTHRHNSSNEVPWEIGEQDQRMASPDVWDEAWRSVQASLVRECLMRLLPEQREVIELAYFEGRTQSEIARTCQIPLGTVKARMRLALRHLKRELEKRGMSDL